MNLAASLLLCVVVAVPAYLWASSTGRERADTASQLAQRRDECLHLVDVGEARRYRPPTVTLVRLRGRRREAGRARGHGLPHDVGHRRALLLGGLALVAVVAHHEQADRGVSDVRGVVQDGAVPLDGVEVLGERLEVPRDPGLQRGQAHVLDVVQRPRDQLAVLGPARRDREPTVPRHHARDAVP